MTIYAILTWILIAEGVILVGLLAFISLHRLFRHFQVQIKEKKKELFVQYYLDLVNHQKKFEAKNHPPVQRRKKLLLQTLEDFNRNLGGAEWDEIKKGVIDTFLILFARKKARSLFWLNRNFAARVFLLHAYPEDEALLLRLMEDKRYLVRNPATFAAIRQESEEGIRRIFEVLNNERGYTQFIYRDALIQGSAKVFDHIIAIGSQPQYHVTALKILAARSWGKPIPFLENDLQLFHYPEIRYWALKVLLRNPLLNSLPFFLHGAHDPNSKIRALCMEGISTYPSEESASYLEKGLSDPTWEVRLQAGKGLKRLGEIGLNVLNNQKEGMPKEVAQYVIEFG